MIFRQATRILRVNLFHALDDLDREEPVLATHRGLELLVEFIVGGAGAGEHETRYPDEESDRQNSSLHNGILGWRNLLQLWRLKAVVGNSDRPWVWGLHEGVIAMLFRLFRDRLTPSLWHHDQRITSRFGAGEFE